MHLGKRVLITGAGSGLGQFLYERIEDSVALTRLNRESVLRDEFDIIIHCAFNSSNEIADYYQYVDDNILLTQDLTRIPHNKFVYISSVDVYQEENSFYKLSKVLAESIVTKKASNPIILRCSSLLGPTMRSNNFTKLLGEESPKLSLSSDSEFNYVRQQDVFDVIISLINSTAQGIIDCCASSSMSLEDVAHLAGVTPSYGKYVYKVSKQKGCINKTSEEVIREYLDG